jgi:hypothetical protein
LDGAADGQAIGPEQVSEERSMPIFDRYASKPSRAEADLLRSILGPGNPRVTSLRSATRDYRRRQRGAMLKRAFVVLALGAAFIGSAFMMSSSPHAIATRALPTNVDPVATGSTAPHAPLPSAATPKADGR